MGEEIEVQDTTPSRFRAEVVAADKQSLTIRPIEAISLPIPPAHSTTLLQAFISEQNIDLILQKTTELGVTHIVLFHSEHSPHMIPAERLAHKKERWQQILINACEQSGRPTLPTLIIVNSLGEALEHITGALVLLSETGSSVKPTGDTTIVVGPEGGLSGGEISSLKKMGAVEIKLGPYTLRSETAAIVGVGNFIS